MKKTSTPCLLNTKKTTTHVKSHRKITGVTINHNNKLTTPRSFYRQARAIINGLKHNHKHIQDYGYDDMEHYKQVLSYHLFIDETKKLKKLIDKNIHLLD